MSRDPEDGKPINPKSLHKYTYAGGDPVSSLDSTGREATEEYGEETEADEAMTRGWTEKTVHSLVNCLAGIGLVLYDLKKNDLSVLGGLGGVLVLQGCFLTLYD